MYGISNTTAALRGFTVFRMGNIVHVVRLGLGMAAIEGCRPHCNILWWLDLIVIMDARLNGNGMCD